MNSGYIQQNQDSTILNIVIRLERKVARVHKGYTQDPANFSTDFTRQEVAILHIQRACEAALDMEQHIIRKHILGVA